MMNSKELTRQKNDLKYFENIFLEYYPLLCVYSFQIIRDRDIAKDIVQDVFSEIWEQKRTIDFDRPIKSFLYTSVRNKSIDYLRRSSTKQEFKVDDWMEETSLKNHLLKMHEQEDIIHFKNLSSGITSCINNLPPQCQKIFKLSREQGLKNKEIATLLDITVKAIEKQMTKALSITRECLIKKGLLPLLFLFFF